MCVHVCGHVSHLERLTATCLCNFIKDSREVGFKGVPQDTFQVSFLLRIIKRRRLGTCMDANVDETPMDTRMYVKSGDDKGLVWAFQ